MEFNLIANGGYGYGHESDRKGSAKDKFKPSEPSWLRYQDLGVRIVDFFVDISQDLFVFVEERVDDR